MRKQISQKIRFSILERDWFCCKYCWRKPPNVQLEVDHIIPINEWWNNELSNLITSCFDCNRWKWKNSILENSKNLYKVKINNVVNRLKNSFYTNWNNSILWNIDEKTKSLLSIYIINLVKWKNNDNYKEKIEYFEYSTNNKIKDWNNYKKKNFEKWNSKFLLWWDYCDIITDIIFEELNWDLLYDLEYISDDDNWRKWLKNNERLNYYLTKNFDWEFYIIKKYTLFPNAYTNE